MPWGGHPAPRKPPPGPPGWYSVKDVAKALRVHEDTVLAAIHRGLLAASKVGRAYRVSPAALDAYLVSRSSLPVE
jgi:excisionase family DNA binding protein